MSLQGRLLFAAEHAIGYVWMAGEVALMATRIDEIRRDPFQAAVAADIAARGFAPIPEAPIELRHKRGFLVGPNPYVRVGDPDRDRVVARWSPAKDGPAKHLLVVCHCYGIPSPAVMSRLFGVSDLPGVDVAYNITGHHVRGSFPLWPGSGLLRGRMSRTLENLRAAATGARALVHALKSRRDYRRVTILGFSIGGFISLHAANAFVPGTKRPLVDRAILYCPVVDVGMISRELGLFREFGPPLHAALRLVNPEYSLDVLAPSNPLSYPLAIPEADLTVITQENDAMTPLPRVAAIRAKYPGLEWHAYGGTHVVPFGKDRFREIIRKKVSG